jgi:predicted kinase
VAIFIGLQASGKSSFYHLRLARSHEHVSKDLMPQGASKQRRMLVQIERHLAAGRSVAVDNTSAARADRVPLVAAARAHEARVVGYYFSSRLVDCLPRNAARAGEARVPDVALYATAKRLERPSLGEGFDALFLVRIGPDQGFEVLPWEE